MDLISNIKFIENRPGGRKPNHGKSQFAQKNPRINAADEKKYPADSDSSLTEYDTRLGRKVDISA